MVDLKLELSILERRFPKCFPKPYRCLPLLSSMIPTRLKKSGVARVAMQWNTAVLRGPRLLKRLIHRLPAGFRD